MARVTRRKGETLEQMMKRFNRKVEKEGILEDEKKHRYKVKKQRRNKK